MLIFFFIFLVMPANQSVCMRVIMACRIAVMQENIFIPVVLHEVDAPLVARSSTTKCYLQCTLTL